MDTNDVGLWSVIMAIVGGAIRVGTPFIFVSLGECLTEKSGRINLGLEGNLITGAMVGYAVAYLSGSPWCGVLAAAASGFLLGGIHALLCQSKKVNDIAVGIAMMLFATGIAFFYGKPFIQPSAPHLPSIAFGDWSHSPIVKAALNINVLFFIGVALAPFLAWFLTATRWGNSIRVVGESSDAALAMGMNINVIRLLSTAIGGSFAGVGGSYLSLYYPGSWSEGLSSGQGLMAVALVIFARWDPIKCLYASLLFGGAAALGPALQSIGVNWGYYLFNAAPYVLTLGIMIATSNTQGVTHGMPGEFIK